MKPAGNTKVADLLQERINHFAESAKAKWEKMTRTHSSEWYKQSVNKELNERGSRVSVLVEGLRHPDEALARTDLDGMTLVAKDYFHTLHTPEPTPPAWEAAQSALLEEVRVQSLTRPDPKPEDIITGPFMTAEMKALTSKMPNTAPGPDGIHYVLWNGIRRAGMANYLYLYVRSPIPLIS